MVTTFSLVVFAASLITLLAAGLASRKRQVPGGTALALLFLSIAVWSFFSGMETTSLDAGHRYLWSAMSYIGLCNVTPLLLVFAIQYSDSAWPLSWWMLAIFWSVPAATLVLAFTNGAHHLIWTGISAGPVAGTNTVIYHHGPWFTLEMLWFLTLSLLASWHLLRVAVRAARLYILQSLILLAGIILPWIGLLLFVLPKGPTAGLDTTSIGFALSALLIMAAFNRLHLLDLVPRARAALVESLLEGFLVVDLQERIVDTNPTAVRLLGITGSAVGETLGILVPALGGAVGPSVTLSPRHDPARTLEVSVTPLTSRAGRQTGKIFLVRDITERQKLITDLQDALASVKRLSGLLPICASCKKIRDDKGYWHQVERYVADHAGVEFSHGLCPDCVARLYPGLSETPGRG